MRGALGAVAFAGVRRFGAVEFGEALQEGAARFDVLGGEAVLAGGHWAPSPLYLAAVPMRWA
ncbi:hypothetical protein D3C84_1045750 [compost metagenome]